MKWSWKIAQIDGVEFRIHLTFLVLIAWLAVKLLDHWQKACTAYFRCRLHSRPVRLRAVARIRPCAGGAAVRHPHTRYHAAADRRAGAPGTYAGGSEPRSLDRGGWSRGQSAIAAVLDSWLTFMNTWQPFSQVHLTTGPWARATARGQCHAGHLQPHPGVSNGWRPHPTRATIVPHGTHARHRSGCVGGAAFAFVMGLIGLFVSPMLLLIGLFVWIGAAQEANAVRLRSALSDTPARARDAHGFRDSRSRR